LSVDRAIYRLHDIKQAIGDIRQVLNGFTYERMLGDVRTRAAFERLLEIVSEASRHVPQDWRTKYGADIPWSNVATIGNVLRHVYRLVDHRVLWNIYQNHLGPLEAAVDEMIAAYDPTGEFSPPPHPSA
jgi:uncharacterized protein with HEPN domain